MGYNKATAQALGSAVLSGYDTYHRGMVDGGPPCPAAVCASVHKILYRKTSGDARNIFARARFFRYLRRGALQNSPPRRKGRAVLRLCAVFKTYPVPPAHCTGHWQAGADTRRSCRYFVSSRCCMFFRAISGLLPSEGSNPGPVSSTIRFPVVGGGPAQSEDKPSAWAAAARAAGFPEAAGYIWPPSGRDNSGAPFRRGHKCWRAGVR